MVPRTQGRTGHFSEAVDRATMAPAAKKRPADAYRAENMRNEVVDLTDYFNLAAKKGIDDVLWCGWNAEQWSVNQKTQEANRRGDTAPSAACHGRT